MIEQFIKDQASKLWYLIENGGFIMMALFVLAFTICFKLTSMYYKKLNKKNHFSHFYKRKIFATNQKFFIDDGIDISMVKGLISICPLVGLLGSTTGMVAIFNAIELYGTGAPQIRLTLPRVVIPTLVSLLISVSGLVGLAIVRHKNKN